LDFEAAVVDLTNSTYGLTSYIYFCRVAAARDGRIERFILKRQDTSKTSLCT